MSYDKIKPLNLQRVVFFDYDLEIIFDNFNLEMFLVRFLRVSKSDKINYEKAINEFQLIKDEIIKNKYIKPKGIYRIFKVISKKDYLNIISDDKIILFPLEVRDGVSISDFLYEEDYVAFTSVSCFTNDEVMSKRIGLSDYKKNFLINSINVMLAEAFTELLHYMVIKDMGFKVDFPPKQLHKHKNIGKRYSPGYPGLNISANLIIHNLLSAKDIDSRITESFMIEPESSVQSLIVYNPNAFYLS